MGGSEDDEAADAPAWLSRAAARYGGLDELAEELGSERREHVSDRGIDETLDAALDDSEGGGPEAVVADRGVDDVFAEIEAAAPDPDVGTTEERSAEDHPLLDTGPQPSFDSLAGGPDREVVEDGVGNVEAMFEEFEEDDPAEVAAAHDDPDAAADESPETPGPEGAIGSVPADLFEDLGAAVGDDATPEEKGAAVGDGASHDATHEDDGAGTDDETDDVFEWVETASSPMTDGEASAGTSDGTDDPFDSLADRTDPAPTDVLDDGGDEGTDPEVDADTRVGAWKYDHDRGLHLDTGSIDGTADGEREDAAPAETREAAETTRAADNADTPDDGLVGPEHAPDDLDVSGSDDTGTADGRMDLPSGPGGASGPMTATDDPVESAPDDRPGETVLDATDTERTAGDPGHRADGESPDATVPSAESDDDTAATTADRRPAEGEESDPADPVGDDADTGEEEPERATGPDALDEVADGPEDDGVIGRVRSFIGRLLP